MPHAVATESPFRLLRKHHIGSLNIDVEEYVHRATGAIVEEDLKAAA